MPSLLSNAASVGISNPTSFHTGHFFFFIFNFDNYYHFLYDTLPYLVHYFELIKTIPSCQILIPENHRFLTFQTEFLTLLGIQRSQIVEAIHLGSYERLYVPSSLTHGKDIQGVSMSNAMYSPDAMTLWNRLRVPLSKGTDTTKFYISRRTHIHNDMSNIGTNYTLRRRCINEDEVVKAVAAHGYKEIFCELLSTEKKIELFQNATHIIGFIGGGLANLLFSKTETQVGCIETPDFLRINRRFKHSMDHTRITYLPITSHVPFRGPYSLYTRAIIRRSPYKDQIGELLEWDDERGYKLAISNNDVAGFAHSQLFTEDWFQPSDLEALDKGLNSPFICDIAGLNQYLLSLSE
jgi:hypothetical protein